MRIDPEGGLVLQDEGVREIPAPPLDMPVAEGSHVQELIAAAMAGTLDPGRPLQAMEPTTFSPMHIAIVFDRALGFRPGEIAAKYSVNLARISTIIHHPYAEIILGAIAGEIAERITDPVERIKSYAHEAITTKVNIMRDPQTPRAVRNHVASDILDRAGYGARRQIDISATSRFEMPQPVADRVAEAASMFKKVREVDYTAYVEHPSQGSESSTVPALPASDSAPEQRGEASLADSPASRDSKVA